MSIPEDLLGLSFEQENNIHIFENTGPQNNESNFKPYTINVKAPLKTINEGKENAANNNGPPTVPKTEGRPINLPSVINPFNMPETAKAPKPVAAAPPYNPFDGGSRSGSRSGSANKRRRTLARK